MHLSSPPRSLHRSVLPSFTHIDKFLFSFVTISHLSFHSSTLTRKCSACEIFACVSLIHPRHLHCQYRWGMAFIEAHDSTPTSHLQWCTMALLVKPHHCHGHFLQGTRKPSTFLSHNRDVTKIHFCFRGSLPAQCSPQLGHEPRPLGHFQSSLDDLAFISHDMTASGILFLSSLLARYSLRFRTFCVQRSNFCCPPK